MQTRSKTCSILATVFFLALISFHGAPRNKKLLLIKYGIRIRALAYAIPEIVWIQQLTCGLHVRLPLPAVLRYNKVGAMYHAINPFFHA